MINIVDIHHDPSKDITIESIPGYRDRIRTIVIHTIQEIDASSDLTESIWNRVLESFFNMLLIWAMSPRRAEYIVRYGFSSNSDFYQLLVEIWTYHILSWAPEYFLNYISEYPEIFKSKEWITSNPNLVWAIQKRIDFLKSNNQFRESNKLQEFI